MIPRKCTVLRLQPFENRILGLQKVEILNSDTSVRASHGRRARTSDHQDSSGAELTNILQVSVLRRKIVHMPKRRPVDLDGSTCLNIIFEHVRRVQRIKTSSNILKPNSKLGFLVCVRFGIIFQCRDLPDFSGGMLSSGATNH